MGQINDMAEIPIGMIQMGVLPIQHLDLAADERVITQMQITVREHFSSPFQAAPFTPTLSHHPQARAAA